MLSATDCTKQLQGRRGVGPDGRIDPAGGDEARGLSAEENTLPIPMRRLAHRQGTGNPMPDGPGILLAVPGVFLPQDVAADGLRPHRYLRSTS